ncbi:LPXTG cell wall anchor domain-containing protein [Sulfurimonas diazotrophicus]|uniref:LPXTG cell wall anchor domain-containing protein n=1 Tax=Sulfurimonas diazotrophicus TaxID=3131939 RepID=A0ABZ3HDB1_9BACT
MPGQTLPLKDIKPIVAVPDHSLWLLTALVAVGILLLGLLLFWLLKRRRNGGDPKRTEALKRLQALDFSDTKSAVYDFSLLGHFVATPETMPTFRALLAELEPYKYQKSVPALDTALETRLRDFIKEARRG